MNKKENKEEGKITHLFERFNISWKQIAYLLMADTGYALALNLFYVGNNIAAGGIAGLGTILNYFFSWPIGLTVFCLTIPIALFGIRIKGAPYVIMALLTTMAYSFIVDALSFLPCITDDKIVAIVFGGILYGGSSALTIKARMSSGGSDLLSKLLITKFKTLSLGTLYMCVDGTIVVLAMFSYGNIESGIYALLAITVTSVVTDKINSGLNRAQMFYIFANQNDAEIADAIMYEMGRGVTAFKGTGKYSGEDREIIMAVVTPSETPKMKEIVHRYDPSAFVVLVSANEIIGNGFEDISLINTVND